jgi:hypothetical protein
MGNMITPYTFGKSLASISIITAVIFLPLVNLTMRAQATQQAQDSQLSENPFPRTYQLTTGTAVLYPPQVASWDDQKHAIAWSAVSYEKAGAKEPALGTIKLEAETSVALDDRLVKLSPAKITEINFRTLTREETQGLSNELQRSISQEDQSLSLDRVLAAIDRSQLNPKNTNANGLRSEPPKIFYSSKPAILVGFDGDPIWCPIKDVDLKYAVNTNWDVFQYPPTKTFYLRNDTSWLKASNIEGPWSPAGMLPPSFLKLPPDDNWKEVKAHVPGKAVAPNALPTIFVSKDPAELIAVQGPPKYQPVTGTSLLWVSNTESDLFRNGPTGLFFYLVAGRWFSAADLNGPWMFATPNLPADFQKIPVEHERSRVLASVPGSNQAAEAVLLASIPQTARVNVKDLQAPEVMYQGGQPQFQRIENTQLERAVNTDKDIVKYNNTFYMCYQGVWFVSSSPTGPWSVTKEVPSAIYGIPPSSASYHTTYVTEVQDDNPNDDWVTFAAGAGYMGMMIGWGCAIWGSGWYYPPYYWYGGFYPPYYWYPRTYGFAAWYNPYTGTFGRGAAVYGPFGGAGAFAAYNPRTGTYARGASIYGPYASRSFAQAYNPRTGTYAQTRQTRGIYGNWGSSAVVRGDNWVRTGHITNRVTGTTTRGIKTSEGGGAITRKGENGRTTIGKSGRTGDVYAGHDGNVYRKQNGEWQKWDNGGWNDVNKPEPKRNKNSSRDTQKIDPGTMEQLDRDSSKRKEGNTRTKDRNTYQQNRGGRNSAGSFRGGGFRGGGFRGGGRRR